MGQIEWALVGASERTRVHGGIAADKKPRELAQFLTTFLLGLRVTDKARADRASLGNAVEVAVGALDRLLATRIRNRSVNEWES